MPELPEVLRRGRSLQGFGAVRDGRLLEVIADDAAAVGALAG
jgi:hypothetical protein